MCSRELRVATKKNIWIFILLACTLFSHAAEDSDSSDNEPATGVLSEVEGRLTRSHKCPGCQELLIDHLWGPPNRLCVGNPNLISNPDTRRRTTKTEPKKKTKKTTRSKSKSAPQDPPAPTLCEAQDNSISNDEYLEQLNQLRQDLAREEETLKKEAQIRQLEQQVREQQNRLELLRQNSSNQAMASAQQTINQPTNVPPAHAPSPLDTLLQSTNGMNSNDPFRQNSSTQAMASSQQSINQPHPPPHALSSLDSLLQSMAPVGSANGMNTGFIPPSQPVSQQLPTMPTQGISTDQQTDMFLRPAASTITSHGKPCRIVDYVSRLLPQDDRRVLSSEDGQARLVLDCGTKKVKLESVTIAQWNIANLRIFHHLINLGRLSTPTAVREYLAYSVKILELSTKFSWSSVLRYDDEYRTLQHIYGYSWSQDHSH